MQRVILLFVLLFIQSTLAQPATLTLRAKLRDFRDQNTLAPFGSTPIHPDFENDAFMDCGGQDLGYVRNTLSLDGSVDSTVFPNDNRNPVLQRLTHPTSNKPCFTSMDRFNEWYNDNPAINRRFYLDLTLTRNSQGLYTYNSDHFMPLNAGGEFRKFDPADPEPFGPIPTVHPTDVWGFTMELHTRFTYMAGAGQVFTFKGDDDVWVFINGRLAIDLGGLHSTLNATINLDQQAAVLGLVHGQTYPLDFFFAERHSTASRCQITTSLELVQQETLPTPVASPASQGFQSSLQVAVSVPGHADAQIRYTLDGSEPTESSLLLAGALTLTATTTLKAKAFKAGFLPSPTLSETYTREWVALPLPVANPTSQTFRDSLPVSLSVPGHTDAVIRYSFDGRIPDSTSSVYAGPLILKASDTLIVRAFKTDWLPSGVVTEVYTLLPPPLPPVPPPPPNVVTLRVERPVSRTEDVQVIASLPILNRPIAVVSVDASGARCVVCPPQTDAWVTTATGLPEWTTKTRGAFSYIFRIYDHLGHFVIAQSGEVSAAQVNALTPDAEGFRVLRFWWIPVAANGQIVGTGAYILQGEVSALPAPGASAVGLNSDRIFTRIGFMRVQ
jgi:fibro-slime domain-containing protein